MRNSVKVVVDAYNGTMSFYVFDQADPMIRTYEKIFPGMFKPASAMPASLRAHVRYPQDFFTAQAEMFATYHVTDPTLLYNKGNQWQIPTNVSISGAGQMNPYYMIMRLPGQTREEFVLILPFTPNGRTNMIAWLGAQSDAPNYGKAVSFEFPSSLTVYGPAQVEAAVNQNPTISAQRTLWGQQGSSGDLRQPDRRARSRTRCSTCSRSTSSRRRRSCPRSSASSSSTARRRRRPNLPTGQQQNVVMEPTLGGALTAIFGGAPPGGGRRAGRRQARRRQRRSRATHRPGQRPVRCRPGGPAGRQPGRVRAADQRPRHDALAAQGAALASLFAAEGRGGRSGQRLGGCFMAAASSLPQRRARSRSPLRKGPNLPADREADGVGQARVACRLQRFSDRGRGLAERATDLGVERG